jgi:plastocyanin
MLRLGVVLLVLVGLLAGSAAGQPQATPTLHGVVGPGFSISLRDDDGKPVSHLDQAGTYTIEIQDLSDAHNFHLTGPGGVDRFTDVGETGQVIWEVTFVDGTYRYVCDAHVATMKGSFTVGSVPPPPVAAQKLAGSVGPGAKISFVRSAKTGKATITIRDRSTADNFHLAGPGVNKKTGVRFKGTVTWSVTFRQGTYTFRSDAHKRLKGTTRVS